MARRNSVALARDLGLALDPAGFMRELGLSPDPWQADLLSTAPHRALLNCCRQSGKSTTAAGLALHTALYVPGSLVLLVSPSLRQSGELFRKVGGFYHQLTGVERAVQESVLRIELANGSRVVSLPGSEGTVRGYSSASLVIADEAARISDDLMAAIRPMLAVTNGRLIAMSTPWGKRGWWHKEWALGGDNWKRFSLRAEDCPRISKEFLADEERALGPFLYRQEYLCEFLDDESSIFPTALIDAALANEIEPLWR
jgi:Terminase large subunit, T4likevirus-type, N-terminal